MPGWKKIATTAAIVVITVAILNRVMTANPKVAKALTG